MSRQTSAADEATGRQLAEALRARTADVVGRPDSLAELRRAYRTDDSRRTLRSPRLGRHGSLIGVAATAAAVLLVLVGVNWIGHDFRHTTTPTRPAHSDAPLPTTGSGYSPAEYFPAVRSSDGQPVIVRASDGQQMRILPRGQVNASTWAPISPMVLSPDGNHVYGVGRQLQDDGKPYPANYGDDHVVSIDLRTNQFTSLATRGDLITGMTLSADGTTFAYSLRGSEDGRSDRDVIYVHDLVHDTDRHFLLAAGQRTAIMALSPDGAQLAINVNSNSAAVQVISTMSGLVQPPQKLLGSAGCAGSGFGAVQWTQSGLYAVRYCAAANERSTESIVRLSAQPDQAATVVATTPADLSTALLIRDSRAGLEIFIPRGAGHVVTKLAAGGAKSAVVPGIRLSGPGT